MHPKLNWFAIVSLFRALGQPRALLGRHLDPALREKVILRVSAVNNCYVCSLMHQSWAGLHQVSRAEMACVRTKDVSDARLRAALDFADARTTNDANAQLAVANALQQYFSAREQVALTAFVDLFTFTNRFNNTWESWLPGAKRRRKAVDL